PTSLQVDTTPRTGILAGVLDEFPRFVAVVIQRDRAVIYVSEQGEREEMKRIDSDVPGAHDQGGWSQARLARHVEFHVGEHMREVIEALDDLRARLPYSYLMLGGTAETTAALEKRLPEPLRAKMNGTFAVDVKHVTDDEVIERAQALRERTEREEEKKLVETLFDEAAAGGQGRVGVADTFFAIMEGRVRELALLDDLVVDGAECSRCEYFDASPFGSCPLCGAPGEKVSNIVERALEKAYLAGAKVNFVFGEGREKLAQKGGLGALLRY
ncbi:MAG: Vms1/Ankzf1 family peptidyl-tRNA hydrolase, partial [Vicinamibacteria bacterium]